MRPRRVARLLPCIAPLLCAPLALGAQTPASGAVHGVVFDSLARAPLAGATVQLVRADDLAEGRTAITTAAGAFRIDSLAPGRYLVRFSHALLDRLRVSVAPRAVVVAGDSAASVALAVPALAQVRQAVCADAPAADDASGLVVGRVIDAADGAPRAQASVVLTWVEAALGADGVRTTPRRAIATTGVGGSYVLCGVPEGEEIVASAAAPGRASGAVVLELPARGFALRDFSLADSAHVAGVDAARITGTVRDSAGRPVPSARISVLGHDATTGPGEDGGFVLGGLPPGTRTLEVRAIGFVLRRVAVELAPGTTRTVDVRLSRTTELDPVTILSPSAHRSRTLEEFFERRRSNPFGRFLTVGDIDYRVEVTDALRTMPGLQIADGPSGKRIMGRAKGEGLCQAVVILDGSALPMSESIDRWVSPQQLAGIEVYAESMYAPPQYGGMRLNNCSVVLVWTKQ